MTYFAQFGSVSHGTMRNEDLIPCFMNELDYHKDQLSTSKLDANEQEYVKTWIGSLDDTLGEIERAIEEDENYYESERADFDLEYLIEKLDELSPPYAHFGSHPGDGADYGFWLSENFQEDFDGLQVSDLSEIPDDYTGEVLLVNDHGNMTLYTVADGEYSEVWSIV